MDFVGSRTLRLRPGEVWRKLAKSHEVIITTRGKPIGVLTKVDAEHVEETLTALRRARAQLAVSKMRQTAAQSAQRLTPREIDAEIRAIRKSRSA